MSPEQAAGERGVTTATDVWSLGAILFHLLTGRPTFIGAASSDVLVQLRTHEVPRLRAINPRIPADLETICLRCLEKEPSRRYSGALQLAEDLERWQRHEPIEARPVSLVERLVKWTRRHPTRAGLLGLSAIAPLAILAIVLVYHSRLKEKSAVIADTLLSQDWQRAEELFANHKAAEGLALLARMLRDQPGNRAVAERILSATAHHDFALPSGPPLRTSADAGFSHAWFSADGHRIVTEDEQGFRLFDAQTFLPVLNAPRHQSNSVGSLPAVSPSRSSAWQPFLKVQTVTLSNRLTGHILGEAMRHERGVVDCNFSSDSQRVVTASVDRTVRVWDLHLSRYAARTLKHGDSSIGAEWNRRGDMVMTLGGSGPVKVWDVRSGQLRFQITHGSKIFDAHFDPAGHQIVTGANDGCARVWNGDSGRELLPPLRHEHAVPQRDFEHIFDARFSPDGQFILTSGEDGTARIWDARTHQSIGAPLPHESAVHFATMNANGTRVLTAALRGAALWDARTRQRLETFAPSEWVISAEFSPGGKLVLIADRPVARLFEATTGRARGLPLQHEGVILSAHFSPDGKRVVTADETGTTRIWDVRTSLAITTATGQGAKLIRSYFSPDSLRVISRADDDTVRVWDAQSGLAVGDPLGHPGPFGAISWSSDGEWLLTACGDGAARLWKIPRVWTPVPGWLAEFAEAVAGLRFNPQRVVELVPFAEFDRIRQQIRANPQTDTCTVWAKSFFDSGPPFTGQTGLSVGQ
jgi:WD40 repeat protein